MLHGPAPGLVLIRCVLSENQNYSQDAAFQLWERRNIEFDDSRYDNLNCTEEDVADAVRLAAVVEKMLWIKHQTTICSHRDYFFGRHWGCTIIS